MSYQEVCQLDACKYHERCEGVYQVVQEVEEVVEVETGIAIEEKKEEVVEEEVEVVEEEPEE